MKQRMNGIFTAGLLAAAVAAFAQPAPHPAHAVLRTANAASADEPENILPGENKNCPMPEGYSFIYRFAARPQLGTAILKLQIFDPAGRRTTGLSVKGRWGMPEMKGAHDSGEEDFKLNRKGDYLLPMNIVMPGEWELRITFLKSGKRFHHGAFKFKV